MAQNKNVTVQIGPGGATLLVIVFVLLKVFGYINWSWWWVFSPYWIGIAFWLFILLCLAIVAGIVAMLE